VFSAKLPDRGIMADNTTRLPCSTLGAWLPTSTGSSSRGGTRLENDDKYDFRQVCETKVRVTKI